MHADSTFRIALALVCLTILPVTAWFRIRSVATGERLDRRQEGPFILATLRPVALVHTLGVLAFLAHPPWMNWSSLPLAAGLRWLGIALGFAAGGLLFWTLRHLGPNLTDTVVTRRKHALVTTGPYRWVRHPFYDCVGLLIVATSLAAANWFLLLSGVTVLLLLILRTRKEEVLLLARFGEAYHTYTLRTGRFLPRGRRQ
jgi:protein-S-isoprenylcysteine O-methyltransferase Ste14